MEGDNPCDGILIVGDGSGGLNGDFRNVQGGFVTTPAATQAIIRQRVTRPIHTAVSLNEPQPQFTGIAVYRIALYRKYVSYAMYRYLIWQFNCTSVRQFTALHNTAFMTTLCVIYLSGLVHVCWMGLRGPIWYTSVSCSWTRNIINKIAANLKKLLDEFHAENRSVLKKLRQCGISGVLSYGLLNTVYYKVGDEGENHHKVNDHQRKEKSAGKFFSVLRRGSH
ncbi:hypothetical protein J1N35_008301 [Gossypium stocksii]|uniref:Uncharacterized protein n=1 Tax=Gossypium stocksii TaxID=47602 RepID=A0A9D3W913_9ROSI|nr:hypothetical protein J1N35_008301 [Gossypium stocksii]